MEYSDLSPNKEFEINNNLKPNKMIKVRERVAISKVKIVELMDKGYSKEEIHQELYSTLNNSQWKKALIACGLSDIKIKKIDFVIEDLEPSIPEAVGTNPKYSQGEVIDKL